MKKSLLSVSVVLAAMMVTVEIGRALDKPAPARFGQTYNEIVALAKKEGKVQFATALFASNPPRFETTFAKVFKAKYDVTIETDMLIGTDSREKILLEMKGGRINYDAVQLVPESITGYQKAGVIDGPFDWEHLFGVAPAYVSPDKLMISAGATVYCIVYNSDLIPKERVPRKWEDMLDPYYKGKFVVGTRPIPFISLYPLWGKQKTLDYSRALAANDPIWLSSWDLALAGVSSGEYPMIVGIPTTDIFSLLVRDPTSKVKMVIPTEAPVFDYFQSVVLKGAKHPNAALLLLGWFASPEGQRIFDKGLQRGSPQVESSEIAQLLKKAGSKISLNSWEVTAEMMQQRSKEVLEAWGFPVPRK
jgi:iron(III) transport system substrate-binding protein